MIDEARPACRWLTRGWKRDDKVRVAFFSRVNDETNTRVLVSSFSFSVSNAKEVNWPLPFFGDPFESRSFPPRDEGDRLIARRTVAALSSSIRLATNSRDSV